MFRVLSFAHSLATVLVHFLTLIVVTTAVLFNTAYLSAQVPDTPGDLIIDSSHKRAVLIYSDVRIPINLRSVTDWGSDNPSPPGPGPQPPPDPSSFADQVKGWVLSLTKGDNRAEVATALAAGYRSVAQLQADGLIKDVPTLIKAQGYVNDATLKRFKAEANWSDFGKRLVQGQAEAKLADTDLPGHVRLWQSIAAGLDAGAEALPGPSVDVSNLQTPQGATDWLAFLRDVLIPLIIQLLNLFA